MNLSLRGLPVLCVALFTFSCGEGDSPVDVASGGTSTGGGSTGVMVADGTSGTAADSTGGGSQGADSTATSTGDRECTIETAAQDCDDNDPCTHDQCDSSLECLSEPWPEGTACETDDGGAGSCQGGTCVVECTADRECDDRNACTLDSCDTALGACDNEALDDIDAPVDAQTPGDCTVIACVDGNEVALADDDDTEDDENACTVDTCSRGVPDHSPAVSGFGCGADGICDGAGSCVECISPDDCNDLPMDDDCQTRTCVAGVCGQDFAPQGTATNATLQSPGDCQEVVCDGAGGTESEDDNVDVPNDGLDCTDDLCTAGVPSNPPTTAGTDCGGGLCDGFGECVGCVTAADCDGTDSFCQTITCIDNMCGVDNAPVGLQLPSFDQEDNDCQELVCDGGGAVIALADDDDLPLPDGNDCTGAVCNNGITLFPDLPLDTDCDQNGGVVCDGAGACVECNDGTQCSGAGQCEQDACSANACITQPVSSGVACDDGAFCTAVDECNGAGACVGAGDPCPGADGDGNCSESCNEATNSCDTDDAFGSPCEDGSFCTTGDTCNGAGTCQSGGPTCDGPDGDADCSETCDEVANNCNAPDPLDSPCDDGLFCTANDSCDAVGVCQSSGDPCPGPDNDDDCTESCSELFNACILSDGNGTSCNDGDFCTQTDTCQSGSCVGSGDPCAGPDGDGNCSESCDEATNSCGGNDPVGSGCDDGQFCTDNDSCNAAGACVGSGNPCDGPDGDGDCTETCDESDNDCQGQDPNGAICDPGGIFGGVCANGLCVGI